MQYNQNQLQAVLADSRYVDIGNLPSNFYPYDFGKLYARPFAFNELLLVGRAAAEQDITHLIRAVDTVITEDVNEITIGDFFYLLLWLKTYSTPKQPKVIPWECDDTILKDKETGEAVLNEPGTTLPEGKTLEDYDVEPCGTSNSEIIHISTVDIIMLPEEGWEGLPEGFDFPRTRLLPEINEIKQDPIKAAEYRYVLSAVKWVAGKTLKDKIKVLEQQPDLSLFEQAKALDDTVSHGIKETCTLTCRKCRAQRNAVITLDALTFFQ